MRFRLDSSIGPSMNKSRLAKVLSIDWLGQTAASICWICSMYVYGVDSVGDWLQLSAASAWFMANLAAIAKPQID